MKSIFFVIAVLLLIVLGSCDGILKKNEDKEPIARVGDVFLYKEDIAPLLDTRISKQDSISFVTNYINIWAAKQLLLSKSKINLSEEKLAEFEQLVSNYRIDLYTRAYKEALVQKDQDTVVSDAQLYTFYEREKENFKLKEKLVQLRFIGLPKPFLNKNEVIDKLKGFTESDKIYLDSVGVQFKKLHFNDSIWVTASRIIEEIPPLTFENQERYLKKSQFFELEDSIGVYLAKVSNILEVNDIAPLQYIAPSIKQVLLNRRKLDYIRRLETEIIDEAIKENEFEVYGQDE